MTERDPILEPPCPECGINPYRAGWREYAALSIVRQAVIDMRRGGDIFGVTTERMLALFPEIRTGYESIPGHSVSSQQGKSP